PILLITALVSFTGMRESSMTDPLTDSLRSLYSKPPSEWPRPFVDAGVPWEELDKLIPPPLDFTGGEKKAIVALGKLLFFDPRLSGSGQISCASCHIPDLSWTDGREMAVGHDQQTGKRNTPTLFNVWFYKKLFWDGRSSSLEDQVFSPVNNEIEMHSDMALVPA